MSAANGEPAVVSHSKTVPADMSTDTLDVDEDDDLEVFSKNTSLADASPLLSPMPNSPGSMVNQYRFDQEGEEEEEEEEPGPATNNIFITVDNPESHVTAIETFIMYRVVTRTTSSDFDSSEYEVHRRYQDFLWLKGKLEEAHPTLILHPLPEKFVMKGMVERFNVDFIEARRKALHHFLNKISEHPILSCNQHFKVFLTAQDLTPHKKQGPSFLSRMGETVRSVANSVRGLRSRPEQFTAMQDYIENFSNKMSSLDKVTQRITKEQKEYLDELKQYGPTYTLWEGAEEELAGPLKGVASCVEHCSKETEEQIHHLSEVLMPALHEYVLCADTVKAVLRRRDNIQAEFEAKTEAVASKKGDQEALKEEMDGLEDRMEWSNNALKGDWPRWQKSMRTDLKSALMSTAEQNVKYYEKCLAVWESFLLSQRTEPSKEGEQESVP
ncbi:sorting nexin-7 [Lampris incognitus]|uniref:sorting nexin-7 n=1 Tax=Lampris incognitus TaxID=2546036 RepID=UPI0024B583CC|nr:sorting nexin-7 [Lampris incognitus]